MNSICKKLEINEKKEIGNQKQKITFAYKPRLKHHERNQTGNKNNGLFAERSSG